MINELNNIILKNNFTSKKPDFYVLHGTRYNIIFKYKILEENYIMINLYRLYALNNQKILLLKEKHKLTKFLNKIDDILKNINAIPLFKNNNSTKFTHSELWCYNCEDHIINTVIENAFNDCQGYLYIHGVEAGRCVVTIDNKSSDMVYSMLMKMKNCNKCEIIHYKKN